MPSALHNCLQAHIAWVAMQTTCVHCPAGQPCGDPRWHRGPCATSRHIPPRPGYELRNSPRLKPFRMWMLSPHGSRSFSVNVNRRWGLLAGLGRPGGLAAERPCRLGPVAWRWLVSC